MDVHPMIKLSAINRARSALIAKKNGDEDTHSW